jgi:hypothetical protein
VSKSIIGKVFGIMKIHQDWLVKFFHAFLLGSLSVSRTRLFFILKHIGHIVRHRSHKALLPYVTYVLRCDLCVLKIDGQHFFDRKQDLLTQFDIR